MGFSISNRRYLGNKRKLLSAIDTVIESKCEGNVFVDLFGGTGTVTGHYCEKFEKCIINDLLFSNEIIYKGFFSKGNYDYAKLDAFAMTLNTINVEEIEDNYFNQSYGGKYFTTEDALKIGYIRDYIEKERENFTEKELNILLASLMYSADRCANTAGHYEAFLKNKTGRDFYFELIEPIDNVNVEIHREDANVLASDISADIVFLDPPYNSRDYGQYYHVLEQIAVWDKKELKGKTAKPKEIVKSEYCKNTAADIFRDLIEKLNCKYILVTYNNSFTTSQSSRNKISYEQMIDILSAKGKLEVFENDYKAFNAGKTNIEGHKELIFFVTVEK